MWESGPHVLRQALTGQEAFNPMRLHHPSPFMSPSQKAWGRNHGASLPGSFDILVLALPNRLVPPSFSLTQKWDCPHMNLSPLFHPLNQAKTTIALRRTPNAPCRVKSAGCHGTPWNATEHHGTPRNITEHHGTSRNSSTPYWALSSLDTPGTILSALNKLFHILLSTAILDQSYFPHLVGEETEAQKI